MTCSIPRIVRTAGTQCGVGKTSLTLALEEFITLPLPSITLPGRREGSLLADETGFSILVCHFPPGTSKWNKVEHRL